MSGAEEFTANFFDTASAAWMANKTKKPNCTVVYKCVYTPVDGKSCGKKVYYHESMVCYQHRNKGSTDKLNITM